VAEVDNVFGSFVPRDYLEEYYGRVDHENDALLVFLVEASRRIPEDALMLEFGGGPTIYQLVSAAPRVSAIHFAEYLDTNLDEVRRWLTADKEAFDWTAFIDRSLELEGDGASRDAQSERARLLRRKVTMLLHCDATRPDPLGSDGRARYDVVGVHFVPESITSSKAEWRQALENISTLLRPGGLLIMSAVLQARCWRTGEHQYPAVDIGADELQATLSALGFADIDCRSIEAEVIDDGAPDFAGYSGMAFLTAVMGSATSLDHLPRPLVAGLGWTDYPTFQRVEDIGRDHYERVLFGCVPPDASPGMVPSDWIWLSLMAWCPDAEAARLGEGILLRLRAYHGDGCLTALVARKVSVAGVRELLAADGGLQLHYVPGWVAADLSNASELSIEPDRANFDYVHDVAEQIAADGARFREIRRRRRQFLRDHPDAEVRCMDDIRSCAPIVLGVVDRWTVGRADTDAQEIDDERAAIERLLGRGDLERLVLGLLECSGECIGFTLAEIQLDRTAVVHFMKTVSRTHGATEVLQEGMFKALASRGVDRLNVEQDLGIPGLRRRKLEENPSSLLEKFVVSIAGGSG
jgi:SAM-dependent methyltransferase